MKQANNSIYLDYSATTPVDPRVVESMLPYFTENFGNPSSENHAWGWKCRSAVQEARGHVAQLLKVSPTEIYFTSGATESNNWVFFGLVSYLRRQFPNEKIHIISSMAEHASVVEPLRHLQKSGVDVSWAPINKNGQVTVDAIRELLTPQTKLVSIMAGNNELGNLNPVSEIGVLCKHNKVYFHTDATQVIGKTALPMDGIDLMSFSGHKMSGPKGVGALYVRSKDPHVSIDPLMFGGGQERGMRSGTINVPLVVGLGEACKIAQAEMQNVSDKLAKQARTLWTAVKEIFPAAILNGHPTDRIPGHLSVVLPGFSHSFLLPKLGGIGVSTVSACHSDAAELSAALSGVGLNASQIQETYRLTIGKPTTDAEIAKVIEILKEIASHKTAAASGS